jgi:branched-chain amino acid transport system substrate-binding protein
MQLGLKIPLYMSHGVASKKFIELAGAEAAEGILLPAGRLIVEDQVAANHPQKKLLGQYIKDYQAMYKKDVSTFGGHAWDAIMLVKTAIEMGKSAEPAAIRDNLEKIKKFQGTAGEFNMSATDHNGLTDDAFVMVKIVKGDWDMLK